MSLRLKDTELLLPSEGMVNSEDNLLGGDSVKVRPFIAADQKILAGGGGDSYRTYRKLLSRIIEGPAELEYDHLLLSDVNAILFGVRILSHGPMYNMQYQCPSCRAQNRVQLDLNDLEVRYASESEEVFTGTGEIKLGDTEVAFRLATLGDDKEANKMTNHIKRRGGEFSGFETEKAFVRIALLITKLDDAAVNFNTALKFVNTLPLSQFDSLTIAISDMDCGVVNTVELECSSCGWIEEGSMAINAEFFRPKQRRS